jgi:transposase
VVFLHAFSKPWRLMLKRSICLSTHQRPRPPAQRRCPKKDGEDQAIGRSRGGLTTKIHAIVDALGNPVALSLTPGQTHDITQAVPLLDQIATLEARGITPVIPPKANRCAPRKTDFALYCERNLVERFFCILKQYRAISTRYDKLANTFLAVVTLICALLWLN